jgi:glycosyltransferase involved in cell wall biosynthesis
MAPLVSALTPTHNRREFFPRAVRCFLSQDYPNLEWIILDDGPDPIKDLLPDDPRIKYFHELPKRNHGQKMNRCFELSQGEFGIVFDDDDWYPAHRISRQIQPMIDNPVIHLTGSSTIFYYQHGAQKAWRYSTPARVNWLASIAIRRSTWAATKFEEIAGGADYKFQLKLSQGHKFDLKEPSLVVAAVHPSNACRKALGSDYSPVPYEIVKGFLE